MDWFERLTGFPESPEAVRTQLEVTRTELVSRSNGRRFGIGTLEIVSLADLRQRVAGAAPRGDAPTLTTVTGDVRAMHRDPRYRGALFQVASQFNLLEMVSPEVTPEEGVGRYEGDPTQGPACAIAAGAATIYRNYFVEVDGQVGQSRNLQVDCLRAVGAALGNPQERLWTMRNGYALCSAAGLRKIRERLERMDEATRDALRGRLQIGLHWNVEVTDGPAAGEQRVSQAFCSALPVKYVPGVARAEWAPFATLVLEAAYEATLLAGMLNAQQHGSNIVLLTRLGGGAFGNDPAWIEGAMGRAMAVVRGPRLDVRLVQREFRG